MSAKNSRKTFLAQLLGVVAGIGLVPKLLARQKLIPSEAPEASSAPQPAAFKYANDPRAVSRREDSV